MTWEQAVEWLRKQPDQKERVRASYYDDPIHASAARYADSDEWGAVKALAGDPRGKALDLGAGRGMCSQAVAGAAWAVTPVEPDRGCLVGRPAIRQLAS